MALPASLAQDPVCEYVLHAIVSGALRQGQKLPTERQLSLQFARPRARVRESLALLEGNGLIVRQVGRGTFVARDSLVSTETLADEAPDASPMQLIEIRLALEPSVAELATRHATSADLRQLMRCHELGLQSPDYDTFERGDRGLHLALAQATHNGLIATTMRLIDRARDTTEWNANKKSRHAKNPGRRTRANAEHEQLVTAVCDRDGEAARTAMRQHLLAVRANLFGV